MADFAQNRRPTSAGTHAASEASLKAAAKNALKTTLLDSITLETRANVITKLKERLREFSKDTPGRSQ